MKVAAILVLMWSRATLAFLPGRALRLRAPRPPTLVALAMSSSSLADQVLANPQWPAAWPYSPDDFERSDESDDGIFYSEPRLVYHIDDAAVTALTDYYATNLQDGQDVLDICSSWVSHYPKDWKGGKVVGLGMNDYELEQNPVLSSYVVKDLNQDPTFPFEDASFDKVTCVVSVDYLNKPLEVFQEIGRVLRPGTHGTIASFGVVAGWPRDMW